MTDSRYGHHLFRECVVIGRGGKPIVSTRHLESYGGGNFSFDCIYITGPRLMIPHPHRHEFDQYLCFASSNPDDPHDFDAEIEMSLGEEQEKHIIASPTIAHIPPGLDHGPLDFVRVGKPVLFVDVAITGKYARVGEEED
jgi:hypothetical protein